MIFEKVDEKLPYFPFNYTNAMLKIPHIFAKNFRNMLKFTRIFVEIFSKFPQIL